jgi:hypothetical protein
MYQCLRKILRSTYIHRYITRAYIRRRPLATVHLASFAECNANAASLSDWTSKLITLLFNQMEGQWKLRNEELQGRDATEHSLFHRTRPGEKATRLYAQAGTLLALDRPILSRPLISQAGPTILRCISDANELHVQNHTIHEYFVPRLRDG